MFGAKMSDKEILEKAIQKAIEGGWDKRNAEYVEVQIETIDFDLRMSGIEPVHEEFANIHFISPRKGIDNVIDTKNVLFNHDFAKALWGEKTFNMECNTCHFIHELYDHHQFGLEIAEPWMLHLTEMVLVGDPIKYLGENI